MSAISNDYPVPATQKASTPTVPTLANIEELFQAVFGNNSETTTLMNDDPAEQTG